MTERVFFQLPADLIGAHVVSLLGVADMVLLDTSAAGSQETKQQLRTIFKYTFPVDVSNCCTYNSNVWNWFWSRSMPISNIVTFVFMFEMIGLNVELTRSPVQLILANENIVEDKKFQVFDSVEIADNVTSVCLMVKQQNMDSVVALLRRLRNVISFQDTVGSVRSIADALRVVEAMPHLTDLCLEVDLNDALVDAIVAKGATLRRLSLFSGTLRTNHYLLIADRCQGLTSLTLEDNINKESHHMSRSGLAAIAQKCRQLRHVSVSSKGDVSDEILLLFAAYSTELCTYHGYEVTILSDAALTALANNCPHLTQLNAMWGVTSVETIYHAVPLLQKIRHLTLFAPDSNATSNVDPSTTALAAVTSALHDALGYLRDIEALKMSGFIDISAESLHNISQHCCWLREFDLTKCSLEATAETPSALAAMARRNTKLEKVSLCGRNILTDEVIEALGTSCPRLHILQCACDDTASTVTDAAVVTLAAGCRRLKVLTGLSGPDQTDVSVLALVLHCPKLQHADFSHSPAVTESALVQLVESIFPLRILHVKHETISDAAVWRLQQLVDPDEAPESSAVSEAAPATADGTAVESACWPTTKRAQLMKHYRCPLVVRRVRTVVMEVHEEEQGDGGGM